MPVGPDQDDGALGKPGDHRGSGGAHHPHGGKSQLAENEDIVEGDIHKHRRDTCFHGKQRLPRLPQGAGVGLHQGEGQHLEQHHMQIVQSVLQRGRQIQILLPLMEEQGDQRFPFCQEQQAECRDGGGGKIELEAECVPKPHVVPLAVELGGEDSRPGQAAEDT